MKNIFRNKIFIIAALLLIAGAGAYFLANRGSNANQAADQSETDTRPQNTVDYSPPSEEEKAAADEQKDVNQQKDDAIQNAGPAGSATVVVADASQYGNVVEVRAYMSNIYEDAGTCTATFTQGSQTVTKSKTAFKDATTTQCGTIEIPRSEFPAAGSWSLKVSYSSSASAGETTPQPVAIK